MSITFSDIFLIGMQFGFGFYCAITLTDLVAEFVKYLIKRKKGE